MKTAKFLSAAALAVVLIVASCSSSSDDGSDGSDSSTATSQNVAVAASTVPAVTESSAATETAEEVSVVVPFTAANGSGTVAVSGDDSPVAAWFAGQSGEVSLDLVDADVGDAVSVVEELVSFWFFQDDGSGDVPPSVFVSAGGDIADSVGTSYVVEAQLLLPAPVAETTTTTSSTSTSSAAASSVPETSEAPSTATSSTTTTTSSTTTTTTAAVAESPAVLLVQVLNGSGVAGAAGRMTDRLSEAGYSVLPAANAPRRYSSSAVYYQEGWKARAEEILRTAEIDEIEEPTAMPQQFASEGVAVIVLLGTDTAPAVAEEQAELRPEQRNDVELPLPASVPRDRYAPGLAAVNLYTAANEAEPETEKRLVRLADWLRGISHHANEEHTFGIFPEDRIRKQRMVRSSNTRFTAARKPAVARHIPSP